MAGSPFFLESSAFCCLMREPQRLLINSMPKSGTHLLTQVVDLLGYQDFGRHDNLWLKAKDRLGMGRPVVLAHLRVKRNLRRRLMMAVGSNQASPTLPIDVTLPVQTPVSLVAKWLHAIPSGQYLSGHLPWTETTATLVRAAGLKNLLIVRDPRDVLVSFLHFVIRPQHVLSQDFLSLSPEQRLILAVEGGTGPRSGWPIVGLRQGFESILDWRREQDVLFVRFEALIGERGDGSRAAQRSAVQDICRFLELPPEDGLVEQVCRNAFDTGAATFRRGKIGAWQDELNPSQIEWCSERFAPILDDLAALSATAQVGQENH